MALLSPVLLGFMATRDLKWAIKTACSLALLFLGFVFLSEIVWQQSLPDYYLPSRLEAGDFWVALFGNLISPSRGLFIFSPLILALPLIFPKRSDLKAEFRWWWLVAVTWPVTHCIVISRFPHWYGGHCYGPRLMVDVLPGLFILFLHYWPQGLKPFGRVIILVLVASLGVWINAIQGLRNPETRMWNMRPNIATHPAHLFDWAYPQFLSNKEENNKRAALAGKTKDDDFN